MRRRLLRRAPFAGLALLVLLGGAFLALRNSSAVRIEDVTVRGASGPDAPKIESALRDAARERTTLNVDADRLRKAVAAYPTVERVDIDRHLWHGVTLTVREDRPVATVEHAGRRVPLAADGRLLNGATPPEDVPQLDLDQVRGDHVRDAEGRRLVALVAAAPNALRRRALSASLGAKGLMLRMNRGPDLWFGDAHDLQAKWKAAARILADPSAEGATYVDVRLPERAAAGGLAPLEDPVIPGQEGQQGQPVTPDPATGTATPPTEQPSTSTGA